MRRWREEARCRPWSRAGQARRSALRMEQTSPSRITSSTVIGRSSQPQHKLPRVLVLLPPSETKRDGGDSPPLRLDALSHPALDTVRKALVEALVVLAADPQVCRAALGLSAAQDA